MKVSVAIMAHPRRKQFVEELLPQMDTEPEVIWDRHGDRWDTGRRAMQAYGPGATHMLVIQDDAIVSRDLVAGVERALRQVPASSGTPTPLSLYTGRRKAFRKVLHQHVGARRVSWLTMPSLYWGVGVVMPVELIGPMIAWGDGHPEIPNYDLRMGAWLASEGITVWYPWPSLVDHRHSPSLVAGRSSSRRRHAYRFIGTEKSALSQRWDRGVAKIPHWKD